MKASTYMSDVPGGLVGVPLLLGKGPGLEKVFRHNVPAMRFWNIMLLSLTLPPDVQVDSLADSVDVPDAKRVPA